LNSPVFNLVAAFENWKIEGLRQFVLDAWTEMTANSEFARNRFNLDWQKRTLSLFTPAA